MPAVQEKEKVPCYGLVMNDVRDEGTTEGGTDRHAEGDPTCYQEGNRARRHREGKRTQKEE